MTKPRKVVEEVSEFLCGDPPIYYKTKVFKREKYGFWIPSHGFWFWPSEEDQDWLHEKLSQPPDKLDGRIITLDRSMLMDDDSKTLEERPATEEEKEKLEWFA